MFLAEKEFYKMKTDGRIIVVSAALDSQCFFLSPNCNKCTYQSYKNISPKCLYDLHTEKCYVCNSLMDLEIDADECLGRPEFWQVSEIILDIHYDRIYRGKSGRSFFNDREKAVEMADQFRFCKDGLKDFDYTYYVDNLTYDDYIKLEKQNRVVILPCKIGEKYCVAEPDCSECKYKNDGYKGCGYIQKKGESTYTCNYNNEIGKCYVFNQNNGNTFYIKPANFEIKEIYLMSASQYDLDRKALCGVWVNKEELEKSMTGQIKK